MAYEKNNPIPIGVPGAPWPTMLRHEKDVNGVMTTSFELGVIEDLDDPLMLYSARSYPEVMGEFYRNMPAPSMLPAFEFVIDRANPWQRNKVANLVSNPGVGKSFLAVLAGKARDPRGPIVTDAGGKNLEYLLFENVFDVEESRPLTQTIDQALSDRTLSPLSVDALRKFGEHFTQEGGRMSVDWRGLAEDQNISLSDITNALDLVKTVERWDSAKLGIGFKTKKGPLVLAHEQGRDIVIDELNKAKPGTETPLQIVWQVLNGEIGEHTVQLGSNGTFTFKRGQGGFVVCTGNLPKDGIGTHLISESFDRRVPGFRVPDFAETDWQHRICQKLTGLPISTLHRMQTGKWQRIDGVDTWVLDDPEAFTKLLFNLRTVGLSEEDKRNIPDWQMSMISNWQNVLTASSRLSEFYFNWSQLVDPESQLHKTGSLPGVLTEVDDLEEPTPKVTPSTMIRNIEDALQLRPRVKEASKTGGFDLTKDWSKPIAVSELGKDPVEAKFGERLIKVVMDEVYRISAQNGKPELYDQLRATAEEAGLVGSDPAIAKLLSVDPTLVQGSNAQARRTQGILASYLRGKYADLQLSDIDEEIVPLSHVQTAMEQLAKEQEAPPPSAFSRVIHVPNTDIDTIEQKLFVPAVIDNIAIHESLEEVRDRFPADALLTRSAILNAVALPSSGLMNLKALWNKSLTEGAPSGDEMTAIAQNDSSSGIAVTSFMCRKGSEEPARYSKMHIVANHKLGRSVIVGDGEIAADLRVQLKRNGMTYVDLNDPDASLTIRAEVSAMMDAGQMALAKQAFLVRNELRPDIQEDSVSFERLLSTDAISRLVLPMFVSSIEPDKFSHAHRAQNSAKSSGGLHV